MKRNTPNNMARAVKLIMAKGYNEEQATTLATDIFNHTESANDGSTAELLIERLATAEEKATAARKAEEPQKEEKAAQRERKPQRITIKIG